MSAVSANPSSVNALIPVEPVSVQLSKLSKKVDELSKLIPKMGKKEEIRCDRGILLRNISEIHELFNILLLKNNDDIEENFPQLLVLLTQVKKVADKIPSAAIKSLLLKDAVDLNLKVARVYQQDGGSSWGEVSDALDSARAIPDLYTRSEALKDIFDQYIKQMKFVDILNIAYEIPDLSIRSEALKAVCNLHIERNQIKYAEEIASEIPDDYIRSEAFLNVAEVYLKRLAEHIESPDNLNEDFLLEPYLKRRAAEISMSIPDHAIRSSVLMRAGKRTEALEAAEEVLDPRMKSSLLNVFFNDSFEKRDFSNSFNTLQLMDKAARTRMIDNKRLIINNSFKESLKFVGKEAEKKSKALSSLGLVEEAWIAIKDCKDPINPELIKALSKAFCERKDFETAKDMLLKIEDAKDQANAMDEVNAAQGLHLRAIADLV